MIFFILIVCGWRLSQHEAGSCADADSETDKSSNLQTQQKSVQFITEDLLMTENRIMNVVVCPPTSKGHHSKISEAILQILICKFKSFCKNSYLLHRIILSFPRILKCKILRFKPVLVAPGFRSFGVTKLVFILCLCISIFVENCP